MPGTFPVGHFSYLLLFFFFFNFSMYTILHYHIYQFILHLPQPVLLSSASGIRLSLCSFQFTGQSLLNNIVLVLLQQQLTSVELLHEPLQHLSHGSSPPNFRGGDLKISDRNNWGGPEQKIKLGWGGGGWGRVGEGS